MVSAEFTRKQMLAFADYCQRNSNGKTVAARLKEWLVVDDNKKRADLPPKPPAGSITDDDRRVMWSVRRMAANAYDLRAKDLKGARRFGSIPRAHQITAYACHRIGYSDAQIGNALEEKRTSISARRNAAMNFACTDKEYLRNINVILQRFGKEPVFA